MYIIKKNIPNIGDEMQFLPMVLSFLILYLSLMTNSQQYSILQRLLSRTTRPHAATRQHELRAILSRTWSGFSWCLGRRHRQIGDCKFSNRKKMFSFHLNINKKNILLTLTSSSCTSSRQSSDYASKMVCFAFMGPACYRRQRN